MSFAAPRSTVATAGDIPADTAWLTLRRRAADDIQERELYASIDGRRIAILLFGDAATFPIPPGHHHLQVHNTISRRALEFDAAPGQHVQVDASNMRGKGFAYWAFFLGAAMMRTRLERAADGPPSTTPPADPVYVGFRVG